MKWVLLIITLLSSQTTWAQNDFMQIKFEIHRPQIKYNHFEVSVFCKDEIYYASLKSLSERLSSETKIYDSVYVINKAEFDAIAQMASAISTADIVSGMNPSDPSIYLDGVMCKLSISVFQEEIEYHIISPMAQTHQRNLSTYLQVFKNALLTVRLNPNQVFK